MTITYKLYIDFVDDISPTNVARAKNKNKAKSKNHKETAAGKSTWQTFEAGCQAFIDELAQEYVSVGFTASPTIANVQGAPGKYLVCQAIMCGQKLT